MSAVSEACCVCTGLRGGEPALAVVQGSGARCARHAANRNLRCGRRRLSVLCVRALTAACLQHVHGRLACPLPRAKHCGALFVPRPGR